MKKTLKFWSLLICLLPEQSFAQLALPKFFADHMILQRNKLVNIWGWDTPGAKVTVSYDGFTSSVVTSKDSIWTVKLPPSKEGGPYKIVVSDDKRIIKLHDVYYGDLWFCSGQSNMNFRMKEVMNHSQEIADADYPEIRQLDGIRIGAEYPQKDIPTAAWISCSSKTVDGFSAVAYLFAKQLYKKNNVPVGIINASWGGSPIETFMSATSLTAFPDYLQQIKAIVPGFIKNTRAVKSEQKNEWIQQFYDASQFISDKGILNRDVAFFEGTDWRAIHVPGYVDDQQIKAAKGISWYKKDIELKVAIVNSEVAVDLGRINYASTVFINGKQIGSQWSPYYSLSFKVPGGLLKVGKNEILICAYNDFDKTGFQPLYHPKIIVNGDADGAMLLDGEWQYKQGKTFEKTGALGSNPTVDFENGYPTLVYNAMIAPFRNMVIKGFLWYQGENNTNLPGAFQYEKLLTCMIGDWRHGWQDDSLPFLIVQLPNYGNANVIPHASGWALVQEAQSTVANKTPHSGFITTNDLGNPLNIHPTNKQEVGNRLAMLAQKVVYGEKLQVSGPQFKAMKKDGNRLVLTFDQMRGTLNIHNDSSSINGFTIAGVDHQFYRATAKLKGDEVIVYSDQVSNPIDVRYNFESNPPKVNFYNSAGLPAVPFRTDKLKDAKERY